MTAPLLLLTLSLSVGEPDGARPVPAGALGGPAALRAAQDLAPLRSGRPSGARAGTDPSLGPTGPEEDPRRPAPGGQEPSASRPLDDGLLQGLAADIVVQLAELAGLAEVPDVTVRLAPRAAVEARARLEVDRAYPPARRREEETVAKALGMLPAEADLAELRWRLLADDVGGVRDSVTDEVLVAEDVSPNLARLVLAHELAQRLGDALPDVDAAGEATDARIATQAVREARNMLLVAAWLRANLSSDDVQALVAEEARRARAGEPLPPYVWKPVLGLYAQGQAFLARQARVGPLGATPRSSDVAAALAAPPRTTEELLHPARYWEPEEREPATPVTFAVGALPEGWRVVHEDTLGELVLALMATPLDQRRGLASSPLGLAQTRYTNAAAEGWDGDRVLLARRDGAWYVRLVARWDDADEAAEFLAAVRSIDEALGLGLALEQHDALVDVAASSGLEPAERAALGQAIGTAPPGAAGR